MGFTREYTDIQPSRSEIEATDGPVLLEFGNCWCGHCRRASPLVEAAFEGHEDVRHAKVADASGRRLGRLFGVKLWPTLVFLRDGKEVTRLVRPADAEAIRRALAAIEGD